MLTQICAEIRNYFSKREDRFFGDFSVVDGKISPLLPMADGQYFRVVGSVFNDGVHRSDDQLTDEGSFHGAIWLMRVPQEIIDLDAEITRWIEDYSVLISSPYTSESFGGYSYTKKSGSGVGGDDALAWQSVFANRLNAYRRIRVV